MTKDELSKFLNEAQKLAENNEYARAFGFLETVLEVYLEGGETNGR